MASELELRADAAAAMAHLSAADAVMARLVANLGPASLSATGDYFFTLVDAVAAQQLNGKVAQIIMGRIRALVDGTQNPGAADILALPDQALRDTGLSWRKVSYIKDLAEHVVTGKLEMDRIAQMEDEEIIGELVAVKGIGRWTAEMFLIFSLARPDVLAVDDYGLRSAIMRLYSLPELPKPAAMRAIGEPWRPYRSYASLYLWRSADNTPEVGGTEVKDRE